MHTDNVIKNQILFVKYTLCGCVGERVCVLFVIRIKSVVWNTQRLCVYVCVCVCVCVWSAGACVCKYIITYVYTNQILSIKYTAAQCSAAAHCRTLQHTAAHRTTLQHTALHCTTLRPHYTWAQCNTWLCSMYCNTWLCSMYCNTWLCSILPIATHDATHVNDATQDFALWLDSTEQHVMQHMTLQCNTWCNRWLCSVTLLYLVQRCTLYSAWCST